MFPTLELNSFANMLPPQNVLEVLSRDIVEKKEPIVDHETKKTLFNNFLVFVGAHTELLASFEKMMATLSPSTCVSMHFGNVCIQYNLSKYALQPILSGKFHYVLFTIAKKIPRPGGALCNRMFIHVYICICICTTYIHIHTL